MGSPPITLRPFFYYYFWNDAFIWRVRPCKALATILGMPGRPVGDPSLGWEAGSDGSLLLMLIN